MKHVPNPDLCAASLLSDLAALDDHRAKYSPLERRGLLADALETASWLLELGGGPFDAGTLVNIQQALSAELGASS